MFSETYGDEVSTLVRALIAAWNAHDADRLVDLYSDQYVGQDVGQPVRQVGVEAIRASFVSYFEAFPDARFQIEDVVTESDRVAVLWIGRGTHRGAFMKIPPTVRVVEVRGVSFLTIRNGKIEHGRHVWDVAGALRQIGLLPDL